MSVAMPHITWLGFAVIVFALQCLRAELVIMSYNAVIKDKLIPRYSSVLSGYDSGMVCAKKCLSDPDCLSFAFNTIRKECYMYDSYLLESENATDDLGTQVFNGCFTIPFEPNKSVGTNYFMHSVSSITSKQMCDTECSITELCNVGGYVQNTNKCSLYKFPVIEAKLTTMEDCRDSCIIDLKCITMAYRFGVCFLYSVGTANLTVTSGVSSSTMAAKSPCYPL